MSVTISLYNHTAKLFANGDLAGDTFKINLYSAFTFDATATTKSGAESGATQLTTQYGYTQNSKELGNAAVTTVTTNDAKFDADDVEWTASGGAIGPARYALIYTVTGTEPLIYIDFGENKTADNGTPFKITWDSSGIITWTYT